MSKKPIEYVKHIADECLYIISVTSNLLKNEFLDDEALKRAVNDQIQEVLNE